MPNPNTERSTQQVSRELQQMGDVEHAEPVESDLVDEPPRHRVTFEPSRRAVPLPFQKWMKEHELVIMSAELVDGDHPQLRVELQYRPVL